MLSSLSTAQITLEDIGLSVYLSSGSELRSWSWLSSVSAVLSGSCTSTLPFLKPLLAVANAGSTFFISTAVRIVNYFLGNSQLPPSLLVQSFPCLLLDLPPHRTVRGMTSLRSAILTRNLLPTTLSALKLRRRLTLGRRTRLLSTKPHLQNTLSASLPILHVPLRTRVEELSVKESFPNQLVRLSMIVFSSLSMTVLTRFYISSCLGSLLLRLQSRCRSCTMANRRLLPALRSRRCLHRRSCTHGRTQP